MVWIFSGIAHCLGDKCCGANSEKNAKCYGDFRVNYKSKEGNEQLRELKEKKFHSLCMSPNYKMFHSVFHRSLL